MLKKISLPPLSILLLTLFIFLGSTGNLLLLFGSVLLHEAGHLLMMLCLGVRVERITLLPLGIDIKREERLISYQKEIAISSAGAVTNLLIFLLFLEYELFACTNLLYALLNLLPIKGLDGGSILESALLCFLTPRRAESIMRAVTFVFCLLLWAIGIYIMLIAEGNISIFLLSVFLFISTIMKK